MRKLIDRAFDAEKVVIFGLRDLAQLAQYYFNTDPGYINYIVSGFTINREFMTEEELSNANKNLKFNLPIVAWEEIVQVFPPKEFKLFAPINAFKMNGFREQIFNEGKKKGYKFVSYISSWATVLTESIGENVFIQENNTIQPFVKVGDNTIIWANSHIGHHSDIGKNVFITSEVCVSGNCVIKDNCYLAVNSTIRDGLTLAESTLVGMGTTMTKSSDAYGVYMGTPGVKQTKSSLAVI